MRQLFALLACILAFILAACGAEDISVAPVAKADDNNAALSTPETPEDTSAGEEEPVPEANDSEPQTEIARLTPEAIAAAAEYFTGEWKADGDGGYLVVGEDNSVMWYMDETKPADYVLEATYEVTNILVSFSDPSEITGWEITLHYTANTVAGEYIEAEYDRFYELHVRSEDSCRFENLDMGNGNDLVRQQG